MNSFTGDNNYFFEKQIIWIFISLIVFFAMSSFDVKFFKKTSVLVALFCLICGILVFLLIIGTITQGAVSWFNFRNFSVQPSDPAKIILILILAKYFSKRHIEIAHIKYIIISGLYALILFILIVLQGDFGSALIIFFIWLGMIMVSGVSKKHLVFVCLVGIISSVFLWSFVFKDYQKARIITFLHPLADIQGFGYNAYQSAVAVGSGEIFGKGVGYGTQSRLQFLPEYQTDFVFAAFSEEWGFVGVLFLFAFFGAVFWRILINTAYGATNFEILYGLGYAIFLMSHFVIHIGMNIGLLPITGITIPFLSYGGSHLLTVFLGLGVLMSMRSHNKIVTRESLSHDCLDVTNV